MPLSLNLNLANVEITKQSPISVFYKHFLPNKDGRFVPTLYRNAQTKAKEQFLADLAKTKEVIMDISATMDYEKNEWFRLTQQTNLKFDTSDVEQLKTMINEVVKQTMSAIAKDEHRDLYDRISIDLIIADSNREQTQPQAEVDDVLAL